MEPKKTLLPIKEQQLIENINRWNLDEAEVLLYDLTATLDDLSIKKYESLITANAGNDPTSTTGYWKLIGGGLFVPKVLPYRIGNASGTYTIGTGNENIDAIDFTDAAIAANIGAVTDITDPAGTGGWTTLLSITGQSVLQFASDPDATVNSIARFTVHNSEDAGDAIRMRITVDGDVAWDVTGTRTAGADSIVECLMYQNEADEDTKPQFKVDSSFLIEAARVGTFTSAASVVVVSELVVIDL